MRRGIRQRGFSLIELLVALFVIVIITSLVTLNVSSGGQQTRLRGQVENMARVAEFALDEAQLSGADAGLLLRRESGADGDVYGYAWRQRLQGRWQEPTLRSGIFEPGTFPPGVELSLQLEDFPLAAIGAIDDEEQRQPQVVFYASGEVTPGVIELRDGGSGELLWRVEWDMLGRFNLLPGGRPAEKKDNYAGR